MDSQPTVPALLNPELQDALRHYLLPHLALEDAVRLAMTSAYLRRLVHSVPDLWTQKFKNLLPWHPPVDRGLAAAQVALRRNVACTRNLASGRWQESSYDMPIKPSSPSGLAASFSPSADNGVLAYGIPGPAVAVRELLTGATTSMEVPYGNVLASVCWHADQRHISILCENEDSHPPRDPYFATYDCKSGACVAGLTPEPPRGRGRWCVWSPCGTRAIFSGAATHRDLRIIDLWSGAETALPRPVPVRRP